MSGEIEAAGGVIEGGLVGRQFESEAGENEQAAHGPCPNCSAKIDGNYCANCGQPAHLHRSLGAFWHDIVHGVLHFDGKFWRTLPLLAWQPGKLTHRYIHGERARFISPMALFLFAIFTMFAVFAFVGGGSFDDEETTTTGEGYSYSADMAHSAQTLDTKISDLEEQLGSEGLAADDELDLREAIIDAKRKRNGIAFARIETPPYPELLDSAPRDNSVNSGWKWFDKTIKKGLGKANTNPGLLAYKLQSNGYKFAWLLIPISLPFVWLAMIGKRGYHFYDHAVFTTYSIAFACLMLVAAVLAREFTPLGGLAIAAAILYMPFHMYRQIRHAYNSSRFGALCRTMLLLTFVTFTMLIFGLILFVLGALG